jgi:hypothetical protein
MFATRAHAIETIRESRDPIKRWCAHAGRGVADCIMVLTANAKTAPENVRKRLIT